MLRKLSILNPFAGSIRYFNIFKRRIGKRLYLVFSLAALAGITEGFGIALALPLLSTLDISAESNESTPEFLRIIISALGINNSLEGILTLIILVFILKGLIQFALSAYSAYLQAQLLRSLKAKVFDAYSKMSYAYYTTRDTGHFINVIEAQVTGFYNTFISYTAFLTQGIKSATYVSVAVWIAWQFGLMAIILGIMFVAIFGQLNRHVKNLSRRTSKEMSHLSKLFVQSLQAFKYLSSTNQVRRVRENVMLSNHKMTGYRVQQGVWAALTGAITEPLSVIALVAIVYVQISILNQPLTPILVSMVLFHRGINSLLTVQHTWQRTLNLVGTVDMVEDELLHLKKHREKSGPTEIKELGESIRLNNIFFRYDANAQDTLKGISLEIPVYSTVALVGKSGAGKTTLFDIITLLFRPSKGELLIDGVQSEKIDLKSWRNQIGYVSQETVIFDDTIAGNIALEDVDLENDTELLDRVKNAARKAHLAEFIEELEDNYNTVVGDRGVRLSGGQRQRLFIARELFKQPNLLLLDEATSALDSESERAVQASIDGLRGKMTVVIIAHRLSSIRNADHVVVLENGAVIEQGSYGELSLSDVSRFKEMLELQEL